MYYEQDTTTILLIFGVFIIGILIVCYCEKKRLDK